MDPENAEPRLLEFHRLIPDSVGIALRASSKKWLLSLNPADEQRVRLALERFSHS